MTENRLSFLFYKMVDGTATDAEKLELANLTVQPGNDTALQQLMTEGWETFPATKKLFRDAESAGMLSNATSITAVKEQQGGRIHRIHFLRRWGWAAASVFLLVCAGTYLWQVTKTGAQPNIAALASTEIGPGKTGAILTLANGRQVVLDSIGNGIIANENGTTISLNNGLLSYNAKETAGKAVFYNTMRTPNGRQFQLVLPDNSKVWLNAGSAIKYPTVFNGKERRVEIQGEAYFEITKNARLPFKVSINESTEVEVLGTAFNINAYQNEEAVKTTLAEGSIRIKMNQQSRILEPGQQAVSSGSEFDILNDADLAKVLAWKNGIFNFDGLRLKEVMRQLERWYDIKVIYEKKVPDAGFYGEVDRNVSLPTILKFLQGSGIHFRMEGNTLHVLP